MFFLFDLNVCFSKGNSLFVYIAFAFLACENGPFKHIFTPGPYICFQFQLYISSY